MSNPNPQSIADQLRALHWEGRPYPVDPVFIAQQLDMKVYEMALDAEVSGAIVKERGKAPVIVVSNSDSNTRKRFSVAHEIGHYVLQLSSSEGNYDEYEHVDFRDNCSRNKTNKIEVFCNYFAAYLLMPTEEVHRLARQNKNIYEMSSYFDVSGEAMKHRLTTERLQLQGLHAGSILL